MKRHFECFLLAALFLMGCKNPTPVSQSNVPAKYSVTIGIHSAKVNLDVLRTEEIFDLLTARAKAEGIVCQSIEKSLKNHQITFNIISQRTKNGEEDAGLDAYVHQLSNKSTLGFWDVYRNTDEPVRTILLPWYQKYESTDHSSLALSFFNSDSSNASAILAQVAPENRAFLDSLFQLPEIKKTFPADMVLAWSSYPVTAQDGKSYFDLYALKKSTQLGPFLTGKDIQSVKDSMQSDAGVATILLDFKPNAALILAEKSRWAAQHSKREFGIVVDGTVTTAPSVYSELSGGRSAISGNFDLEDMQLIINKIKISAFPFEMKVLEAKKL
jgi:hypothetical protein